MTEVPCEICRGPQLHPDGRWSGCGPCETAAEKFNRSAHQAGDPDYAYHELAHHVMLFGSLPHRKRDWDSVEETIRRFPQGRAQVHELRTLALQFAGYTLLGWRPTISRVVGLSWPGIKEVDDLNDRGRPVVTTQAEAEQRTAEISVSPAKVRMYSNAVRRLRGEA